MGIDNCVTIAAGRAGHQVSWSITGDEGTVNHYEVFVSADGSTLHLLGEALAGTRTLDLAAFSLAPGSYQVFVKAVGQPSLRNQVSAAVEYIVP